MRYLLALAIALSWTALAVGQTTNWTGTTDDSWEDGSNWDNGLPVGGGTATIDGFFDVFYDSDIFPGSNPLGELNLDNEAWLTIGASGGSSAILRVESLFMGVADIEVAPDATLDVFNLADITGGYVTIDGSALFDQFDISVGASLFVGETGSITAGSAATLDNSFADFFGLGDFQSDLTVQGTGGDEGYAGIWDTSTLTVGGDFNIDASSVDVQGIVDVTGTTDLSNDSSMYVFDAAADFTTNFFRQTGGSIDVEEGVFNVVDGAFSSSNAAIISDGQFTVGTASTSGTAIFGGDMRLEGSSGVIDVMSGSLTVEGEYRQRTGATLVVQDQFTANGGAELRGSTSLILVVDGASFDTTSFTQKNGNTQVLEGLFTADQGVIEQGDFDVGDAGFSAGDATFGTLDISGASTLVSIVGVASGGDQSFLRSTGAMTLAGAELRIGEAGNVDAQGGLTMSSGKITGYADLVGNLIHDGGSISPGVESGATDGGEFGTLNLTGDYTINDIGNDGDVSNDGTIDLQIGGNPSSDLFDRIILDGDVTINGGQVIVQLANSYDPTQDPGAQWDVIQFTGSLAGDQDAIDNFLSDVSGLGLRWDTTDVGSGTIRLVAVPEPATYGIGGVLAVGMLVYGWRRRRKRQATTEHDTGVAA